MFTFKKLALVGAAGLAAFAMSCSDDNNDPAAPPPGGKFDPALTATDAQGSGVKLGGKIIANEGGKVTSVIAKANGVEVTITGLPAFPADEVDLSNIYVSGICTKLSNTTSIANLEIVITANFSVGSPASDTESLTNYSCTDPLLTKHEITLSNAGKSFGDVDAGMIYSGSELDKATSKLIDLIANIGSVSTPDGKIYTPAGLPSTTEIAGKDGWSTDIFWDLHGEACTAAGKLTNDPDGCGVDSPYSIGGWALPSQGVTAIKNATKLSEIQPFLNSEAMDALYESAWKNVFDSTVDSGFLLVTSKGDRVAVIVKSTGAQLVVLGTTAMP